MDFTSLGGVEFQDDKVSRVSRDWGKFYGKNALDLFREVNSAIASLQETTGRPIVAYPSKTQSAPGFRSTGIEFSSGARSLSLLIVEGDQLKGTQGEAGQIQLQETLTTK